MHRLMLVFGLIGTAGLMLVSVAMNVRFGQSLGASEFDGIVFGGVSASADLFKCFLPFLILGAWQNRRIVAVFGGIVLWCVFTAYSLTSSLGFSALSRAEVEAARGAPAKILATLRKDALDVARKLDAVAPARRETLIEQELRAARGHVRWRSTAGCTDVTARLSIAFCGEVQRLHGELQARRKRDELERERATLIEKADALRARGVMADADPQSVLLGTLFQLPANHIKLALIVLLAALVELGSSLGLFLVVSSVSRPMDQRGDGVASNKVLMIEHSIPEVEMRSPTCWIDERVTREVSAGEPATVLYEDFRDWCARTNTPDMTLSAFCDWLQRQGFAQVRRRGREYVSGARLR